MQYGGSVEQVVYFAYSKETNEGMYSSLDSCCSSEVLVAVKVQV